MYIYTHRSTYAYIHALQTQTSKILPRANGVSLDLLSPQCSLGDWAPEVFRVALAPGLIPWTPVNSMLRPSDESQTSKSPRAKNWLLDFTYGGDTTCHGCSIPCLTPCLPPCSILSGGAWKNDFLPSGGDSHHVNSYYVRWAYTVRPIVRCTGRAAIQVS